MRLYRSTFVLRSASASRWQADTLFGHLCWHLARRDEATLDTLLDFCREGIPPVLLSDGFPSGWLPKPLVTTRDKPGEGLCKCERIQKSRVEKDRLKGRWLRPDEFNRACHGEAVLPPADQPADDARIAAKNQIDRRTDTAGSEGGALYDFEEFWLKQVDVYWRIEDGYETLVREFLDDLKATGYGKRKSVGYGEIESFTLEKFDGFAPVPQANGFVSLSNFVPAASDPAQGFWTTAVKYGKLGEEAAVSGNPFKRPLIQLAAGACFYASPVREWYGRLVANVATDERVVQYGFAFPIPARLP